MSTETTTVDWERIELDYRAGILSLREIAAKHPGTHHVAITRKAKSLGWTRDLAARIKAKADELVTRQAVTKLVTNEQRVTEQKVVDANAAQMAAVRLSHRKDIQRKRSIVASLMEELEAQVGTGNAALLADLGELMRTPDDKGQDKRNDLYRAIISLPERAKTAKTLAETLRIAIDMERQAFGMDKEQATSADPLADLLARISAGGSSIKPVAVDPERDDGDDGE